MVHVMSRDLVVNEKFVEWCQNDLPKVQQDERIWGAFLKHSDLSEKKEVAEAAITWGEDIDPMIIFSNLQGDYGNFDPDAPSVIELSIDLVRDFDPDTDEHTRRRVEATILHEMVHWALRNAGKNENREKGRDFEDEAYPDLAGIEIAPRQPMAERERGEPLSRRVIEDGVIAGTYNIRSGDTLARISVFHKTSVDELLALNREIENPNAIFPGQVINVPETLEEGPSIHAAMAEGEGPLWYDIACREMDTGVDEIPGRDNHNPRIVEYHQVTTLKATNDETPWCSSFVNWCIMKAGVPGTRSAAARSWLRWGVKHTEPRRGCVVVFSRPPSPTSGHVAFFVNRRRNRIHVLGGNQSDQVNIASYSEDRLLGYRWPGHG